MSSKADPRRQNQPPLVSMSAPPGGREKTVTGTDRSPEQAAAAAEEQARTAAFKLTVLSPRGSDPEQYFDQPVTPESAAHAPVNFHAFAACTGGSFQRETGKAIEEKTPILLLLRGDFKATQRAPGRTVVVSLKETGLHQIAQQMSDGGKIERFLDIMNRAQGVLATTPEAV